MEKLNIEDLNNQELSELLSILEGMDDELKGIEKDGDNNEKND